MNTKVFIVFAFLLLVCTNAFAQKKSFEYLDVYDLQYVSEPQISPDGSWIVYRRMGFNIMTDRAEGNLWMIRKDGSQHQKLTSREVSEYSPRWSPSGDRLAFVSSTEEGSEIYMYWVSSGKFARISQLPFSPSSLSWSPKGDQLAFSMNIPKKPPVLAKMPEKPKGAKWADSPRITDRVYHEADGRGYIEPGFNHLFVISADGGAPRQLTQGDFQHRGTISWSASGTELYFSANRNEDWEYDFRNSEIYSVNILNGDIKTLTTRQGPDRSPAVSPNGKTIAYSGYEDKVQAYQVSPLFLMDQNGENKKVLSSALDRDVDDFLWDAKGAGLYFMYDDKGNTKIAHIGLNGTIKDLCKDVGGTSIGRPYGGGSFSVSENGTIAFTQTRPEYPAELAVYDPKKGTTTKITNLNKALMDFRELGKVEEIWYTSSYDQRDLQGWVVYPPGYDASKKYPFLVENHGGPISNYGDRFTAEIQLYASDGYIVFYPNARGSTSYGEEFGNLLYNNYPGQDYNDVMDGVDYCIS